MKADRKRLALHQEQFSHPARKMLTITQWNSPDSSQIKMNQAPLSLPIKPQAKRVFSPTYSKNATLVLSPTHKRRTLLAKRDKESRSVVCNSKPSVEQCQTTNTDLEDQRVDTQQTGSYTKTFQVEIIQKFLPVFKRTFVKKDSDEISKSLIQSQGVVEKLKTPMLAAVQHQMMFIQEVNPPISKSSSQKSSSIFTEEESSESGIQTNEPTPADSKKNTPKKPSEQHKATDSIGVRVTGTSHVQQVQKKFRQIQGPQRNSDSEFNMPPDNRLKLGLRLKTGGQIQIIEQMTEESPSPAIEKQAKKSLIRSNTKMAENKQSLAVSQNLMLSPQVQRESGFKSTFNTLSYKDSSGSRKLYPSQISVDRTYKTSLNVFDKEKTTAQLNDFIKKAEIDLERERSERHSSKQASLMKQRESQHNSPVQSPLASVFVQKLAIGIDKRLSKPLHELTSKLMKQATELKNTEKSFYNPININEYNKDIQQRKQMLYQLDSQRKMLVQKLEFVNNQKFFNEEKLKLANKKYYATILQSVITIQRWFKSWRIRRFLKTILSRDLELRKKDLVIALSDMQKHIRMQETMMMENLKKIRIQGELEQQEKNKLASQMRSQEYKAWVYVEFEKRFTKVTHFVSRHQVGRAFDVLKEKLEDEEIQRELIIRKQEYQVRRKLEEEERAREMASPKELKVHIQKRVKPALAQYLSRRTESKPSSIRYAQKNSSVSNSFSEAANLFKKVTNHFLSGRRSSSRQQLGVLQKLRQKTSESLLLESPGLKNDKLAKQSPSAKKNSEKDDTQEGISKNAALGLKIQASKKNKGKKGTKKKSKKKNTQSDENVSKISATSRKEAELFEEISLKEIALPGSRRESDVIEEEISRTQSPLTNLINKLQEQIEEPLYVNESLSHVHPNDLQYTRFSSHSEPFFTEQDDYLKTEAQITGTEVSPLIKTENLSSKLNANNLIEFDYEQEALAMEGRKVQFQSFNSREVEAAQPEVVRKEYNFKQATRTEADKQASLKYVMDLVAKHAKGKFQQALNFQMKDKRREQQGFEVFTNKMQEFTFKYKQEGEKQPMEKKVVAGIVNKLVVKHIAKGSSKKLTFNADVSKSKANITFDRRKSSAVDLNKRNLSSKKLSIIRADSTHSLTKVDKVVSKQSNINNKMLKMRSDKPASRRMSSKANVTNALKNILQDQVMIKATSQQPSRGGSHKKLKVNDKQSSIIQPQKKEDVNRHGSNEIQSKKIVLNFEKIDSKVNELENCTSEQSFSESSSDSLASLEEGNSPTAAEAKQKQAEEIKSPDTLELPAFSALHLNLKNTLGPSALTVIQSEFAQEQSVQRGQESERSMSDQSQHSRHSKASKTSKQSRRKNSNTAIKLPYSISASKKNSSTAVPKLKTKSRSNSIQSKLIRLPKGRSEMQPKKSQHELIKESGFSSSSSSNYENPMIKIINIDSNHTTEKRKKSFKQRSSPGAASSADSIQIFFENQSQENYSPKELSPANYGNYHGVFASEKDVLVRKDSNFKLRIDMDKEILEKVEKQRAQKMMDKLARGKILGQIIAKIKELKLQELKEQNKKQVDFHKKLKSDLSTENYFYKEEQYNIEEILAKEHPQEAKIISHLKNLIKVQSELQRQNNEVLLDWEEEGINPIDRLARYLKLKRAEKIQAQAIEQDRRDEEDFLRRTSKGYDKMIRNKEETIKKRNSYMLAMDQIDSLLTKLGVQFPQEKTKQETPTDIFTGKKEANTNGPKFILLKRPHKKRAISPKAKKGNSPKRLNSKQAY